jgi:LacI family transcriptional regulator
MASIQDVANLAQVSTATVSHVLNDTAYVSPRLRDRVLRAVRQLGYQPNALARSLRTKQTKTIGIVIPDITNPFFPAVVRGAEDVLSSRGYTLIIGNSDNDVEKEAQYYRTFAARRVDGILFIISASTHAPDFLRGHDAKNTPIVYVDRSYRGATGDVVLADNERGAYEAVSHLIKTGRKHIGIITGPQVLRNAMLRLEGYRQALLEYEVELSQDLVREGQFDEESGYLQAGLLLNSKSRPDAVFVSNALMTMGCLRALTERRVRVPEEIALVSFDDLEWFAYTSPSITAVAQPAYELGARGAEVLLKRITGELTGPYRRLALRTSLIVRTSTAPVQCENTTF